MITLTPGGFLKSVVEDTSPQLGGDLDGQSLYDLNNMVDGTFEGLTLNKATGDAGIVLQSNGANPFYIFKDSSANKLFLGTQAIGTVGPNSGLSITTAGWVGVGISLAQAISHISGDGVSIRPQVLPANTQLLVSNTGGAGFSMVAANNTVTRRPVFLAVKTRGSLTSPAKVVLDDRLGTFGFMGYDGTGLQLPALLEAFVDGPVSVGSVPARLSLVTGASFATREERLVVKNDGKIGVATKVPTALFDINSDILRLRTAKTPATAGAAGNAGDICWDAGFVYACVAANTWKRAAIAAW